MTFELVLPYYDNPPVLSNWLERHLRTDLPKFMRNGQGHLTIADTGSPAVAVNRSLDALEDAFVLTRASQQWRYIRADTDAVRRRVPPDINCRPTSWVMNLATQYSTADIVIYSVLGSIPPPDWFSKVLDFHERHPRALLQARQHKLNSTTYHSEDYCKEMKEALLRGTCEQTTGMPDFSLRREFLLECGGWDESMVTWGMCDIDLCSRLTGKIDTGEEAHKWVNSMTGGGLPPYRNLGLEFHRPVPPEWFSVVCQDYPGVAPYDDTRDKAIAITLAQYLGQWGVIGRNYGRQPIKHEVFVP